MIHIEVLKGECDVILDNGKATVSGNSDVMPWIVKAVQHAYKYATGEPAKGGIDREVADLLLEMCGGRIIKCDATSPEVVY